ncbi:MAG: hypothetical protein DRO92_03290 [Candidatus Altiarchaeales archaeon]|nr:MAG: hypothetical protein DRO92_03290 [Candidatus Altiarchaeales archaeon]
MRIEIEFISSNVLESKTDKEKMDFILNKIKDGKILVVEESLSSLDESKLIEATMNQIDEKFHGIEVSTLRESNVDGIREKVIRFLGGKTGGLTVIGPSKLIKKIKKEPQRISLLAEVREIRRVRKWK